MINVFKFKEDLLFFYIAILNVFILAKIFEKGQVLLKLFKQSYFVMPHDFFQILLLNLQL